MVTGGTTVVAIVVLVILFMRGGGGRIALTFAALAGGVIGIFATIGDAVFGAIGQAVVALAQAVH